MGLTIHQQPLKHSNLKLTLQKKKEDAYDLLWFTKKKLILLGRQVAWELTANGGTATTRDVRRVMLAQGMYREGNPEHWLGSVFKGPQWVWTGQWAKYSTPPTAKHTQGAWRTVRVWQRRA
jgi:hypothetical protein